MTLNETLSASYAWAVEHGNTVLLLGIAWGLLGTLIARLGKGGQTDCDGRFVASVIVGGALLFALVALVAMGIGGAVLQRSLLDADARLLAAPVLCLAGSLLGIRLVFPLNELGSVRTFLEIGAFLGAGLVIVWMFGKFRGWGLYFIGSISQALALVGLAIVLLRRLYRRAFG